LRWNYETGWVDFDGGFLDSYSWIDSLYFQESVSKKENAIDLRKRKR